MPSRITHDRSLQSVCLITTLSNIERLDHESNGIYHEHHIAQTCQRLYRLINANGNHDIESLVCSNLNVHLTYMYCIPSLTDSHMCWFWIEQLHFESLRHTANLSRTIVNGDNN